MAYPTGDPLYDKQYGLASSLLDLYDPAAEEERRKKALGQMEDVIARRYARAGETGSSVEKDALQNAAKDFSLDWSERQPTRYAEAIRGSQLPISNLLAGRTQDINKALSEGAITGYYGGQPTLARQTAGENFNLNQEKLQWLKDQSTQDLWGGLLGSAGKASGLWDWLFPGQGTGYGGGGTGPGGGAGSIPSLVNWATGTKSLPDLIGKGWDWITGAPAGGLGPLSSAEWTNLVNQLGPISDVSDLMAGGLFPLAGSSGAAGAATAGAGLAGANVGAGLTPAAIEAMTGLSTGAGTGMTVGGAGAGTTVGAGLSSLALPAALVAAIPFLGQLIGGADPADRDKQAAIQKYLSDPQRLQADVAQVRGYTPRVNVPIGQDIGITQSDMAAMSELGYRADVQRLVDEAARLERAPSPEALAANPAPQSLEEALRAGWPAPLWTDIFGSRP